jgi:hypothetical protein
VRSTDQEKLAFFSPDHKKIYFYGHAFRPSECPRFLYCHDACI